jgi:anhydro-N-acetylmuramic acid kinase
MNEIYIGLMSGTSMDAVDAALVDLSARQPRLITSHSHPLPDDFCAELALLCLPGFDEINRLGQLDVRLGNLFAITCNQLLAKAQLAASHIQAIGSHGQTIRHQPQGAHPFTLQIADPNIIAAETGITTVADFRRRDMAKGGQGAPLAPAFHQYAFQTAQHNRLILNLGGIANITWLPADLSMAVIGFDTGPGNTLLDAWVNKHWQQRCDHHGQWASSGKINRELLAILLADPYFKLAAPKSTGREYFNLAWLDKHLMRFKKSIAPADVQATLCELTAYSILQAVELLNLTAGEILICGGGIRNHYLMQRLNAHAKNFSVYSTEEFGVPPESVEAMAFAWLAQQTLARKPGNLPSVTGARDESILGGIYFA